MNTGLIKCDTGNAIQITGIIKGQKNLRYHQSRFFGVRCRYLLFQHLTAPKSVWYSNHIITHFDNHRITYCGKKAPPPAYPYSHLLNYYNVVLFSKFLTWEDIRPIDLYNTNYYTSWAPSPAESGRHRPSALLLSWWIARFKNFYWKKYWFPPNISLAIWWSYDGEPPQIVPIPLLTGV